MVALTAPADSVVLDLACSVGSVVREAEPIVTLVPVNVPLEAEVSINSRDIGLIAAGERCEPSSMPIRFRNLARPQARPAPSVATLSPRMSSKGRRGSGPLQKRASRSLTPRSGPLPGRCNFCLA